jgi:colanic acid/amylovoran biosynthesis glycosyltransferase
MAEGGMPSLLVAGVAWPPETFLRRLISGLREQGVKVTVASATRPDETSLGWLPLRGFGGSRVGGILRLAGGLVRATSAAARDVAVIRGFVTESPSSVRVRRAFALLPFCGRHWSVVYFPWLSAAAEMLPFVSALGMKTIVSCRGSQISVARHNPRRSDFLKRLPLVFAAADAVHCVSSAILEEAVELGLEREKAVVIPPAVDAEFFSPVESSGSPRTGLRLVSVGSLIWRKGYEYLVMAVHRLLDRGLDCSLSIIGDGPELQRVAFTIQDLGLEERVTLLGHLPPEEVRDILHASDIFVLSSLSEGISNAVLEAMACGLPVVTTDCGGMREAVMDGVEGFVVPVRDPEAMAEAVDFRVENPSRREELGRSARARARDCFSLDEQVTQFLTLIRSVELGR